MGVNQFQYQAYDSKGSLQTGVISASSEKEVVASLKKMQLLPVKIEISTKNPNQAPHLTKLKQQELIEFTQGLSTLIQSKVPIDRALTMLAGLTEQITVQQMVESIKRDVKEGKTLAQALEKKPSSFSRMYVNMVRAGEEGGILEQLLPALEIFLVESQETRRQIIGAMIYPAVLFVVGVLSIILMLGFVVPQFATMFEDAGSAIPASAAFLLFLSDWIQNFGWTLLLLPILLYLAWNAWGKGEHKQYRDQFLLSLPLFGPVLLLKEVAAFCRTLGALLDAGIPLFKALKITHGVIENEVVLTQLIRVSDEVTAGMSLGKALNKHTDFPILLSQLVTVGEETGRTAQMFQQLATTFDKSVKNSVTKMVSLAEPMLILVLGILVGGIVITMLSAVFSLNDVAI